MMPDWHFELETKPDFDRCMERIYAWYEGEIIDRPPIRFSAHNSEYSQITKENSKWKSLKDRWFDTEYQIESFIDSFKGKIFLAETFPIYWPNLGPDILAAFYGCELEYGEVTSWAQHFIGDIDDIFSLDINQNNEYFKKIEELTHYALQRCENKFMVGYTDLHPGLDLLSAIMGVENLCMQFYDDPDKLHKAIKHINKDFLKVYNHFDNILKLNGQLSVTWMAIPSFGKIHIPSCDFSAMISNEHFIKYYLPILKEEIMPMDHNIFHLDGKDVAKHLDIILELPGINAIQWVQGLGEDAPIMQWVPLIKKIQAAGKSVVVDIKKEEIEDFAEAVDPKGILLCIESDDIEEQKAIIKRIEKW